MLRTGDELSAIDAVKLNVPVCMVVPVSAPPGDNVTPVGRAPAVMDHVYGAVPPLAATVCVYATPAAPFGNGDELVIVSGGGGGIGAATSSVKALSAVRPGELSVT